MVRAISTPYPGADWHNQTFIYNKIHKLHHAKLSPNSDVMQAPEKKLAGPIPREEPAAKKTFAGRSALIDGLIDAQKDVTIREAPPLPVLFSPESKESRQIMASRQIFETILDIVTSRMNISNFREALIGEAQAIAEARKAAEAAAAKPAACKAQAGKPTTIKEALEMALAELGLDAKIVLEQRREGGSMFTIECRGEENKVPMKDSILELDDPLAKVRSMLTVLPIGVTDVERRQKSLAALRSTRPPPTPLGIDSKELDGRNIHFDGESSDLWVFTYVAKGMETTFTFGSRVTGEDLLDMIDEKIDMLHKQYGQPYPTSMLEWRSRGRAGKAYMEGIGEDILGIACTLDFLATCPARMRELVPPEYVKGFDALKKLAPPYAAFLRGAEMEEIGAALDALDHPIHKAIRELYGEKATLSPGDQHEVASLLQVVPAVAVDVCDAAASNMADAYSLVSGDNISAISALSDNRKDYFRMAVMVRKAINDAIADRTLEIDS
jgi:hypothetical protein